MHATRKLVLAALAAPLLLTSCGDGTGPDPEEDSSTSILIDASLGSAASCSANSRARSKRTGLCDPEGPFPATSH